MRERVGERGGKGGVRERERVKERETERGEEGNQREREREEIKFKAEDEVKKYDYIVLSLKHDSKRHDVLA